MRPIDRNKFKEWLEEFSPEETVGRAGEEVSCPIGRYINQGYASKGFQVKDDHVRDIFTGYRWPLPTWAREFVRRVDDNPATRVGEEFDVSAELALNILEDIEDEAA